MQNNTLRSCFGTARKTLLALAVMLGLLAALIASRRTSTAADAPASATAAAPAAPATKAAPAGPRIIEAAWQDLNGVPYGAKEFAAHPATVLFFLSSKCPCSDVFAPAIAAMSRDYADKGVRLFAVFSNGDESAAEIRTYLASRKLNLAAVRDDGGTLAATVRSAVTPSAVILDSKRGLLYQGAIGDLPEKEGAAVDSKHLVAALTKVLAGERLVLADRVRALGCAIIGGVTAGLPEIDANDNRQPAGRLVNGQFVLRLVAETGVWRPEKADGAGFPMYSFREDGKPLQAPGPLIRVPAGTEMRVTIKNTVAGEPLEVRGLNDGATVATDVVRIAQGEEREFRWTATQAATRLYYASVGKSAYALPSDKDALLTGGLIVDAAGTRPDPAERIFVLNEFLDPAPDFTPQNRRNLRRVLALNGLTWPYTERLNYDLGDDVRWRVINGTHGAHPMHLHGFHFEVFSRNDGGQETAFAEGEREKAVTERVVPGGSVDIRWTPTEVGRWLYHCHMAAHFAPNLRVRPPGTGIKGENEHQRHALEDMSGFVLGIDVHQGSRPLVMKEAKGPARQITVHVREHPRAAGTRRVFSYTPVDGANAPAPAELKTPSLPLVLIRGQRTQITVVNHLPQPTAIHWHGIELESLSDGVVGWGGHASSVTPSVEPGGSFVAEMTPPRAGTFIYHTHFDDAIQLQGGLSGPLIVLEPGETFDPEKERVFVLSSGTGAGEPLHLNGTATPAGQELKKGETYRFRLINITGNNSGATFRLGAGETVVTWRAVAKDGATLPPALATRKPALQVVTVGETRDFEYTPDKSGDLNLAIVDGLGGGSALKLALSVR